MRAKKSYGQHFLHNSHMAEKISALPDYDACPRVLEVGPGRGALTRHLVQQPIQLKVVEADRDMVADLKANSEIEIPHEAIIENDFLKLDLSQLFEGQSFILIGNYPYNISSQILIQMLRNRAYIPEMVGMFQREVADRVQASHGSKTYGTLSVLVQVYYEVRIALKVSPGNFTPPPKVASAVLQCQRRSVPLFDGPLEDLQAVVRAIFGQRRKMLRNSLQSILPKEALSPFPYLDQRPEQLSLEDFVRLAEQFHEWKKSSQQ
jgi:16S rRNA (adenine1518-N6/adenine1519-N6)-dimethyltransferase